MTKQTESAEEHSNLKLLRDCFDKDLFGKYAPFEALKALNIYETSNNPKPSTFLGYNETYGYFILNEKLEFVYKQRN